MIQLKRPIVFFDVETTGTDKTLDRIIEISVCKLGVDYQQQIKTRRVNPMIPIPEEVTKIHGIKNEDVANEPEFRAIAKGIHQFISGCDIAGFNSNTFDVPFLYNEFERAGIVWDYTLHNFIDVCNIYKIKEPRTLSEAVKFYIGGTHEDAHSAEADVLATMNVLVKQLEKYPDLPTDMEELYKQSNYGHKLIDLNGWFKYDASGENIIFNKGTNRGKKVMDKVQYLEWMLNHDFSSDVKLICRKLIAQSKNQ